MRFAVVRQTGTGPDTIENMTVAWFASLADAKCYALDQARDRMNGYLYYVVAEK